MEPNTKEVNFRLYCPKCKFYNLKETEDPCNNCLTHGYNFDSTKPVEYKEKDYSYGRNTK